MALSPAIRQLTILIATLFASMSAGSGMGFSATLLYQLRRNDTEIDISDLDTSSWIGSLQGLGGLLGVIAPIIMQWRGRKFTFKAGCFVAIIGWAIVYAASNVAMIFASELLHGFGANILLTVSFDSLSEMITPAYRNNAVLLYVIFQILGMAMAGVLTTFVHWRNICIIMCLPAVIAFIMSYFWLESPLWLAYKEDLQKSKVNFMILRGKDELSVKEWKEVMAAHAEKLKKKRSMSEDNIFTRFWRQISSRDFIIPALHMYLLLHHVYWCGCVFVLIYSIELISKASQNETAALVGSIILNFAGVFGAIGGNILMRFYKNKTILLTSTCGGTIFLISVAILAYLQSFGYFNAKSLVTMYLLVGYMITVSLGQTAIGYTMSSELIPVKHRGTGGALLVIYSSSLHTTTLKIIPYLISYICLWGTFLFFATNGIIGGFLIWKYIPETKGRTLQEIENFYSNGTFDIVLIDDETIPMEVRN